ncbi:MAG TPA: integrin alpha, partial [Planctomycetota bacterium]|nr:integrin alpha [Planctomycetota bacterium]
MRSRESRTEGLILAGAAWTAFLLAWSGRAPAQGYLLREFRSNFVDDDLGMSVAGIGDVNGDGVPDYLAAAPRNVAIPGYVRCYSGADSTPLYEVSEPGYFGRALAATGDLDGDGISDFVVGAPHHAPSNQGRVTVWSGADGATLLAIDGVPGSMFGNSVDVCGDFDADGVPDFVVGSPEVSLTGPNSREGAASVHSGATGNLLLAVFGAPLDQFGWAVAGVGDVGNQDGVPDLLVGAARGLISSTSDGYAKVLSGADGSAIFTIGPSGWSIAVWIEVAGLSDLDGDGVREFAVGDPNIGPGFFQVFSGATGAGLFSSSATGNFGYSIADAGDANGDGVPDVLVGSPSLAVQVFSGATGAPLLTVPATSGFFTSGIGTSVAGMG